MTLDDYFLNIYTSIETHTRRVDHSFHIKFLQISERKINEKMITLTYFKKKLYIKTETTDDLKLWIAKIEITQIKYNNFFSLYYDKGKEFNFINFENMTKSFIIMQENLSNLVINYDLETFLNKNYLLTKKINDYLLEMNVFYHKLNENNKNEHMIKNKLKEIRSLLNNTHVYS